MIAAVVLQTLNWKDLLVRKCKPLFVPTIVSKTVMHLLVFEQMYIAMLW